MTTSPYNPELQSVALIEAAENLRSVSDRFDWGSSDDNGLQASIESILDTATKMSQLTPEVAQPMQASAYACVTECNEAAADLEMLMDRIPAFRR